MDVVNLDNWNAFRYSFEPGWRWTKHETPSEGS